MHEMSLAEGIMQIVEDVAQREHAARVKSVVVEIGRLSSVQPEALSFCFEAVSRGGVAEGAEFRLVDVPGAGWCMKCSAEVPMDEVWGSCPQCGSSQVQVTRGTEMRVKELEIE